jgi:hypothetical protein
MVNVFNNNNNNNQKTAFRAVFLRHFSVHYLFDFTDNFGYSLCIGPYSYGVPYILNNLSKVYYQVMFFLEVFLTDSILVFNTVSGVTYSYEFC